MARRRVFAGVVLAGSGMAAASSHAGEIRGRILAGGRPTAGVTVRAVAFEAPEAEARRRARGGAPPRTVATAATRDDGTFALALPASPPVTIRLLAEGGGVVPAWLGGTYDTSESDDLGEHALTPAETLAGRVVSAAGAPIAGAVVTIRPRSGAGYSEVAPASRTVTSGVDGAFRTSEASPAGNRLTVLAPSHGAGLAADVRPGAMPRPIVLGLGALVSGIALRRDGRTPAAGALVRYEADGLETPWVEAGEDGRFTLADLPRRAGTIVVEGGEAGLGRAPTGPLPPPPGRVVTVVLAPPPTLEGGVLDTQTRAPVARVRLTVEDGARTFTAQTGPDGRYQVRGLLPQQAYRVRADGPRYTPYVREGVRLAAGETLRLDVPLTRAASLSGRVLDEGGAPIPGALGRIVPSSGGAAGAGRTRAARASGRLVFRTASDGTFQAPRLLAGEDQRLTVVHPEYEAKTTGGLSLPPGSARTIEIVLRRGLALRGRVRDEAGRPVAEALVELGSGRGSRSAAARFLGRAAAAAARPRATTGPDGRFELRGLREGDYSLTVSKEGFADHRLDRVPIDAARRDPLDITLAAGAAIRGTVLRRDGRPAEGYRVRAVPRDSAGPGLGPVSLSGSGEVRPTDADGGFSLEGLRAGDTYDLVVLGPDGTRTRREGVSAPTTDVEVVVAGPGRIAGRVVDAETQSPLTEFRVDFAPDRSSGGGSGPGGARALALFRRAVSGDRGPGADLVRSEDGTFVLEDVPPGTWEVVAQARGYQTARVGGITVEEGGTREGIEVRLTPGHAVHGRVLDGGTGAPVFDASVTLQRPGTAGRGLGQLLGGATAARTDAEGRFAFEGLATGPYTVVAQHPDYAGATASVTVAEGPAAAEVRMFTGGTVAGTVLSQTNTPLSGAAVTLSAGGAAFGRGTFAGPGGQTATTDEAGRFRFRHVSAGRYALSASVRGHRTAPVEVMLQAGESREDLLLSLAAGARILGTVTGLPAAARETVRVTAVGPGGYLAAAGVSADGTFELTGAPAGPVDLRAFAVDPIGGGTRTAQAQVVLAEGQDEVVAQIVFESGFALSGTVTRDGQPVEGVRVSASPAGGGPLSSGRTDASGAYRLEGLSEGTYEVMLLSGSGTPRPQPVSVAGDVTLDLVIPVARLGGVVLDATTREPVPEAVVEVGVGEASRRIPGRVSTDNNGRFSLEDLDTAAYTLTVRKAGYQLQTREVTPSESGGEEVVFDLARGAGIGVEVRDLSAGVPLRTVQARAANEAGQVVFAGAVALDADGRGEIPSLPPGAYVLAVYAGGYAPALLGITAPAPSVVIPLAPGGGVEVQAGPATLGGGGARAQILTAGGQPYPFSFFSNDGRLTLSAPVRRLENLGPGAYALQVEGGERRPFEVQPGRLTVITLP
ncbi:MAG TPA: carboxypeptidase regulatory-like domain-containing protein [Vicinamibacteria bacterium]|nr:carboxypeptidase regulatory-like domain-containing protein [Vicinamibacteria bacterium]